MHHHDRHENRQLYGLGFLLHSLFLSGSPCSDTSGSAAEVNWAPSGGRLVSFSQGLRVTEPGPKTLNPKP